MNLTFRSLATYIPLGVAIVFVSILTGGYFFLTYHYLVGSLETEAAMCADFVESCIRENRRDWIHDPDVNRMLSSGPEAGAVHQRRIVDIDGRVLVNHSHQPGSPLATRVRDLSDGSRIVARLELSRSMVPLFSGTGEVAIISLLVGTLLYFMLRMLPMRAVRRAENSLLQSEYRYRMLFEESKDAIMIVSSNGTIVDTNTAALALFGYRSKSDMMSVSHVSDLFAGQDEAGSRLRSLLAGKGDLRDYEFSCMTTDGRKISGIMSIVELRDRREGTRTFTLFCRDLTAQKVIEQQLLHSQKMEAVGVLAGGVAHDFNSILTIISGFGEILQKRVPLDNPLREYVDAMLAATKRAAYLVKGLLTFSRSDRLRLNPVSVSRMIAESGSLLGVILGDSITLSILPAEHEMTVLADKELSYQVFLNLVTNARDAMPHGGLLTISAAPARIDDDFIRKHGFGSTGDYAAITVSDTGEGISPQVIPKVFQPFFTTKEAGKGTGLGLAIVYGIIKQHNGFILVESEPGKGSSFTIYLPLLETEKS